MHISEQCFFVTSDGICTATNSTSRFINERHQQLNDLAFGFNNNIASRLDFAAIKPFKNVESVTVAQGFE